MDSSAMATNTVDEVANITQNSKQISALIFAAMKILDLSEK